MGGCIGKEKPTAQQVRPASDEAYHHNFKVVILGDVGVGKSSILLRYMQNIFTGESVSTIGDDIQERIVTVGKKRVKLQLSDTAGAERYRQITLSHYSTAAAAILVFDLSKRNTFESIRNWHEDVSTHISSKNKDPPIFVMVGNKTDLVERVVTKEEAQTQASSLGMDYFETTAKDNIGIQEMMDGLAQSLLSKHTESDPNDPLA